MYIYAVIGTDSKIVEFFEVWDNPVGEEEASFYKLVDEIDETWIQRKRWDEETQSFVDVLPSEASYHNSLEFTHIDANGTKHWLDEFVNDLAEDVANVGNVDTSAFASSNHTHDEYATQIALDTLSEEVDGKAEANHTHSDYALSSHSHDNYASSIHSHTVSEIGAAASSHNHDGRYYTETEVDTKDNTTLSSAKTYADNLNATMDSRMDTVESKLSTIASGAEVNQNAFSNVVVGSTTISADTKSDSLTMAAGTGISVSADATNDKVTITNTGVRSIATGSSNGTISVNTNGTSTNVTVKGLGSAAYTASSAYDAAGMAQSKADAALVSAKAYADDIKDDLLNGAGAAYDTLKELGDLISTNVNAIDALETVAASKANASDLTAHISNKTNPHNVTLSQLGVTATAAEINKLDGVTATTAELNVMDGITATTAELNYVDGVTSNIQTQLNGKAASSHTHNYAGSSSAGGVANSAAKLSTARTISLTGDVSGSTSFDGSGNVSITAAVADDSHNHIISNIDGLQSALDGKAPIFTNTLGGVEYSYGSNSGKNVLTEISNMPQGFHTIYSIAGTAGNPETAESYRYFIHKTSTTIGWIYAFGADGSIYSNYLAGANTYKGWKTIHDAKRKPLWTGSYYMTAAHVATPSKKLSECEHGWMLLWSDYDPDTNTVNNTDFCTTMIPNRSWAGATWNGSAYYCDIPRYTAGTATDSESRVIKVLNVYDNKLVGTANNNAAPRNDVVLRAVYEF